MNMLNVSQLKPHSMNGYFFDDIKDENWEQFLESVKNNGIIEPVIVAKEDFILISGHQRVRACKELNIKEIPIVYREYKDDEKRNIIRKDVILEELILTNLRQRGIGNPNPVKMGRCIKELERIYRVGEKEEEKKTNINTQKDLSETIGISTQTLNSYKKTTEVIPEIQSLLQEGKIGHKAVSELFYKLTEEEQQKVINIIGENNIDKMNFKDIKNNINIIKDNDKSNIETIKEIIKIIPPEDYEEIKSYVSIAKKEVEDLKQELEYATKQITNKKISDEGLMKAETERKKIEKKVLEAEMQLNNINKLYGDATNTLKKQTEIEDIIDTISENVKLMESKIIGFKPHKMGEESYKISMQRFEELLLSSLRVLKNNEELIING